MTTGWPFKSKSNDNNCTIIYLLTKLSALLFLNVDYIPAALRSKTFINMFKIKRNIFSNVGYDVIAAMLRIARLSCR